MLQREGTLLLLGHRCKLFLRRFQGIFHVGDQGSKGVGWQVTGFPEDFLVALVALDSQNR